MASEINGVRPGANVGNERINNSQVATDRPAGNRTETQPAPQASSAARAATDSVSLSSGAQAMKAVQEKLQKLPEVNEKRVAQIKAALESGEYKVDELVVADKLLSFDALFE
jgi:negative regulator of flagellin synthesis FlgM